MKYKPDIPQFISYLSGELSEAEKRKFEEWLRENPEAEEEIAGLKGTWDHLKQWPDVEAPAPPVFLLPDTAPEPKASPLPAAKSDRPGWLRLKRVGLGIAASLALLIVTGAATQMEMVYNAEGFRVSFGRREPTPTASQPDITAQLQQIRREMQANRKTEPVSGDLITRQEIKELKLTLARLENRLAEQSQIRSTGNQPKLVRQPLTEAQFNQLVDQISRENFRLVQEAFDAANEEQQEQLYQALNQFARHLDQIRAEDTQMVMASLEELDQKADRKFQETDQALDVLIQTVQSQPQK